MIARTLDKIQEIYYVNIKRDKVRYAVKLGVKIGEECRIIENPKLAFGSEPWLITLGDHVSVSAGVRFLTHEGAVWCARGINPVYESSDCFLPIRVGNNVFIGIHSLIMPGVTIGNDVIIAGHCVVTKDIPDGFVVAGVPAKQISTMEKFMDVMASRETVPTKQMKQDEKRRYLQTIHPEWF